LRLPNSLRPRFFLAYGLATLSTVFLLLMILPYLTPLERVHQAAAIKISALTGQVVTFSGASRHFSLPLPYFTLRNVQVSGSHDGPALLRAPRIDAEVSLLSLFGGDVNISSLTIINPKISLNTDAQERSNWQSPSSLLTLLDPQGNALLAGRAPSVRVGNVKIINGTILYTHDGTSARTQFDDVNATLFWPDATKRFTLRGSMKHESQPLQFTASVQNPAALFQHDISPFDLSVDSPALKAEIQGEIFANQEIKIEAGLKLSSPSLRDLARWSVPKADSIPELGKITANSKLRLHGRDLVLDDTVLQIGDSRAEGSLAFRSGGLRPFLQGTLDFDAVDLRPFVETQIKGLFTDKGLSTDTIKGDNLSALDIDLRLSAKKLQFEKAIVEDAALSILTRENRVELSLGDGKFYDGQMSGRLVAETKLGGGVKAYGTLGLTDIRVGDALRELFGVVRVTGLGEVSLNLSGEGGSAQAIFSSLQGEARLRLNDGSLAGVDVTKLMSRAREKSLDAFLEARKGGTEIESANARFIIKNAVAATEDARLAGPGYRVAMTGKAYFADRSFDMHGEILPPLDAPQDLKLPFVLKGPWFNPNLASDTAAALPKPLQ
jgi:AsmA protein